MEDVIKLEKECKKKPVRVVKWNMRNLKKSKTWYIYEQTKVLQHQEKDNEIEGTFLERIKNVNDEGDSFEELMKDKEKDKWVQGMCQDNVIDRKTNRRKKEIIIFSDEISEEETKIE